MKTRLYTVSGLSVTFLLALMCMGVSAGVNQTPEIQGITTSTQIDCVGTVTSSASLGWTSSTGSIQSSPPLADSQATQTTSYSEDTMAVSGHTVYQKDFSVNTGNRNLDQSNVQSSRIITFEGIDGGRMTSDESLLIDTVSMPVSTADSMLCPFASSGGDSISASCNIVKAGSSVDATSISLVTKAAGRTVSATADVPASLAYSINVHGVTSDIPAVGSVSAYLKAHLQGARDDSLTKSSDFQYDDTSTASGLINGFSKAVSYQSGQLLV
jgi:hypothetical protein